MSKEIMKRIKPKKAENKVRSRIFPPNLIAMLADEVAKTIVKRLPNLIPHRRKGNPAIRKNKIENAIFLDTSAIIDGRIFDVIGLGVFTGVFVILESILLELKHIADSKDSVKKVRGRKGLEFLEKLKKTKEVQVKISPDFTDSGEVDERLIQAASYTKGKIITCDYNLEKKAVISGIKTINVNTLANMLKVIAVPGESLSIKILHKGKDLAQGVGYLDDGTMLVVENAASDLGMDVNVMVSRVIQTTAGRILFAKKL